MKHSIIILVTLLISSSIFGQMRQFQTARTKGVAGAGTASLLMTDGLYLNPATLSWFNQKLIGIQYSKNNDDLNSEIKNYSLSLIDTATLYQGGLAVEKREEFGVQRTRYSASFSKKAGRLSSYGASYRYTKDEYLSNEEKKHQLDVGYFRIMSNNLTLGLTASDLFDIEDKESRGTIGIQYKLSSMLYALVDFSANLKETGESQSFSGAIQMKLFKDLYLRAGRFKSKQEALEGNSFGIGWYPHKFMVDISVLTSEATESEFATSPIAQGEKLKEVSFSIATRF